MKRGWRRDMAWIAALRFVALHGGARSFLLRAFQMLGKKMRLLCLVEALLAFGFGLVGRVEGWVSSCNGFCEKGWVGSIK